MKKLYDYLNVPGLSTKSRRLLYASIYAVVFGRQYNVDGFGLDLCALVADDNTNVRTYLDGIKLVLPGYKSLYPDVAEVAPAMLAKYAHTYGSFCYVSDINMVKSVSKSMARRSCLLAMYKRSGEGQIHRVRLEDGARKEYDIVSPACTSLVLGKYNDLATELRKQKDAFFGRYIISTSRAMVDGSRNGGLVSLENTLPVPNRDVVEHLTAALAVANTLRENNKVISVEWSSHARGHFDELMDARWTSGETHSEMDIETYKKIKKLSALFAVARDYYNPVIERSDITEAIGYLDDERAILDTAAAAIDIREQRKRDLVRKLKENLDADYLDNVSRNSKPFLHELGMVTSAHMLNVCAGLKSFAGDAMMTKKQAMNQAIRDLVKDGIIEILPDTHRLAVGGGEDGKGRIYSDIIYVKGYHVDREQEWR